MICAADCGERREASRATTVTMALRGCDRFFRSLTSDLFISSIVVRCAIFIAIGDAGARDITLQEMSMKHHLIVLGWFLLLATLGFALDIGVTAALLRI
jgi:hypothetical protein